MSQARAGWWPQRGGYNCFGLKLVDKMQKKAEEYDLAFSFAGEHRHYVERVKVACEALGLSVFYDKDKSNEWWGKNFLVEQRGIYIKARYFVPFISSEYFSKSIPSDEFETALAESLDRQDEYILPVLMGDYKVPPEKLPSTTHYLRAKNYSPTELAQEIHTKVEETQQDPQTLGEVIGRAVNLRMPRLTPSSFSKHREADALLEYLGEQIRKRLSDLEAQGLIGTAKTRDAGIAIVVEYRGEYVAGLNVFRADEMGDAAIGFRFADSSSEGFSANTYSGIARPVFDKYQEKVVFELNDYSGMSGGLEPAPSLDREWMLKHLWEGLMRRIESKMD